MLLVNANELYVGLSDTIENFRSTYAEIPLQRKVQLNELSHELNKLQEVKLNFICTHNSRRSHLAQVWAATAVAYFGLTDLTTFSGGTEATALNPRAVAALEGTGFQILRPSGDNPLYEVSYGADSKPMICFSKKHDHPINPKSDFVAVMTCSDADENCPFIAGASLRFPLTYLDPKEADDTPEEATRYAERSQQIGREMCYLVEALANLRNA